MAQAFFLTLSRAIFATKEETIEATKTTKQSEKRKLEPETPSLFSIGISEFADRKPVRIRSVPLKTSGVIGPKTKSIEEKRTVDTDSHRGELSVMIKTKRSFSISALENKINIFASCYQFGSMIEFIESGWATFYRPEDLLTILKYVDFINFQLDWRKPVKLLDKISGIALSSEKRIMTWWTLQSMFKRRFPYCAKRFMEAFIGSFLRILLDSSDKGLVQYILSFRAFVSKIDFERVSLCRCLLEAIKSVGDLKLVSKLMMIFAAFVTAAKDFDRMFLDICALMADKWGISKINNQHPLEWKYILKICKRCFKRIRMTKSLIPAKQATSTQSDLLNHLQFTKINLNK